MMCPLSTFSEAVCSVLEKIRLFGLKKIKVQQNPLNVITFTLGQTKSGHINRMITITGDFYLVLSGKQNVELVKMHLQVINYYFPTFCTYKEILFFCTRIDSDFLFLLMDNFLFHILIEFFCDRQKKPFSKENGLLFNSFLFDRYFFFILSFTQTLCISNRNVMSFQSQHKKDDLIIFPIQ